METKKKTDFVWYLPSMYGDVNLTRISEATTRLTIVGLSPTEKEAVKALFARALKPGVIGQPWVDSAQTLSAIDLDSEKEQSIDLKAPMSRVQDFLQKKLKPHRKMVSAVRFTNGKMEQVTSATLQTIDSVVQTPTSQDGAATTTPAGTTPEKKTEPKPKPAAAVSVAQPVLGCPAPDFDDVEIRATNVLKAFLTPQQVADFERRQQFIAVGADTGHRYLITSRNSKHALGHASYRSLYDIDEQNAFCVHDWEVPAAEELLGLFVHVSIPGLETYVRNVPDMDGVLR